MEIMAVYSENETNNTLCEQNAELIVKADGTYS
jgi:hypothetical protein